MKTQVHEASNRTRAAASRSAAGGHSATIINSPRVQSQRLHLQSIFGSALQPKLSPALQADSADGRPSLAPNRTGLPDKLKSGVESLSGILLDNVRVHFNSSRPTQLNALAYTQGSDIHVAPGQEKHLPHEAWHAVQQAQGRVRPTMQMKQGVPVNDDAGLEREADIMGAKASHGSFSPRTESATFAVNPATDGTVQRVLIVEEQEVVVLPEWIERHYPLSIVRRLANWIARPIRFRFQTWSDAITLAEKFKTQTQPELTEFRVLELVQQRFSGALSGLQNVNILEERPKERAEAFAATLARVQGQIQAYLDEIAPGFMCLVRFYVDDRNAGRTHPGLSSWAYLRHRQGLAQTAAGIGQRADIAEQHMLHGHDTNEPARGSAQSVISGSPMVSTTESVSDLLKADSPFNEERNKALASGANARDAAVSGQVHTKDLRKMVLGGPKKQPPRQAEHVSDRIVILSHGHLSAESAQTLSQIAVASHIAFLVVPRHRINLTPETASAQSCCVLEREVTIYAPDVDVVRWVVGRVQNRLPALTGRSETTRFPGRGQRLGGDDNVAQGDLQAIRATRLKKLGL